MMYRTLDGGKLFMNFLATHSPFSQVLCGRIKADLVIVDGFIGEEGLAGGIR